MKPKFFTMTDSGLLIPVAEPTPGAIQEAYELGLAQGELRGRLALSAEIDAQFALKFDAEEAELVRQRQVH